MTLKVVLVVASIAACASNPEAPPCDAATAKLLIAESALEGEKCAAAGIAYDDCPGIASVNRRKDERYALCKKRLEED